MSARLVRRGELRSRNLWWMINVFLDPRFFNWVLMGLYVCAALRWAAAGNWRATVYWIGALIITVAITPTKR